MECGIDCTKNVSVIRTRLISGTEEEGRRARARAATALKAASVPCPLNKDYIATDICEHGIISGFDKQ